MVRATARIKISTRRRQFPPSWWLPWPLWSGQQPAASGWRNNVNLKADAIINFHSKTLVGKKKLVINIEVRRAALSKRLSSTLLLWESPCKGWMDLIISNRDCYWLKWILCTPWTSNLCNCDKDQGEHSCSYLQQRIVSTYIIYIYIILHCLR